MNLDLNIEPNKQLKTFIATEDNEEVDDEIASQVILLAMKLKRKNVIKTKLISKLPTPDFNSTEADSIIKLKFDTGLEYICLDFNTNNTISLVIDQLNTARKVGRI